MKRSLQDTASHNKNKKNKSDQNATTGPVIISLDIHHKSKLLPIRIQDVPQALKIEMIMKPIFETFHLKPSHFHHDVENSNIENSDNENSDSDEQDESNQEDETSDSDLEDESDEENPMKKHSKNSPFLNFRNSLNWKRDEKFIIQEILKLKDENKLIRIAKVLNLWENKQFVLKAVENWKLIYWIFENIPEDRDLILKALETSKSYNGTEEILKWSAIARNDKEILMKAAQYDGIAVRFPSQDLRNDKKWFREFVLQCVKTKGTVLEYLSEEFNRDEEIVMKAVKQNGISLEFASHELRNHREIVMKALQSNGMAFEYASIELQNEKEIVLQTLNSYRYYSGSVIDIIRGSFCSNDRDVMFEAVKQEGMALEYASLILKNDRDLVLRAVQQDGNAIQFASDELKRDRVIILEAIKSDAKNRTKRPSFKILAFEFIPKEVQSEFIEIARALYKDVFKVGGWW
ncbi:predicted protein [Naegleria gruberi]|uniref:Predicted protein n=1 Tax=Naegleria gruberi TaxID=5762 RepID=D2VEY0_NAEGR|nr:uncharacterized protein NAEGRDRAFT_67432 [Naegleria gruberi]EFC44680.1 predicted protein [Naegleria gruberi]|eukprot:XP_002677424.1 predicted protein [Naegleria gruberi strain NEG-M]